MREERKQKNGFFRFASPRFTPFFFFSLAVFRTAPQLTERLEGAEKNPEA